MSKEKAEIFALNIIEKEARELATLVYEAAFDGLDTVSSNRDTPLRPQIELRFGELLAAVQYACDRGVFDINQIDGHAVSKRHFLLTHTNSDGSKYAP